MKETNTTTNAAFTDEEIDEIMNDPMKKQLAMLYIKYNDVEREALLIFVKALADGKSKEDAAELAAVYLDTCPGYEFTAGDFREIGRMTA